jgi:hypothetical protein
MMLFVLLSGCVLRYGDVPPSAASSDPVTSVSASYAWPGEEFAEDASDLYGLEQRFAELVGEGDVTADQQARLELAAELARKARVLDAGGQQVVGNYLAQLAAAEERAVPAAVEFAEEPVLLDAPVSETLADADPVEADLAAQVGVPVDPDVSAEETPSREELLAQAQSRLNNWDHAAAVELLAPLRGGTNSESVESLWQRAVDGLVHGSRERAGERFIRARRLENGPEKVAEIQAVLDDLEGLLRDYPESSYTDAIERNIRVVKRDLGDAG